MAHLFDPRSKLVGGVMARAAISSDGFHNIRAIDERCLFWDAAKCHGPTHRFTTENVENGQNICKSAAYMTGTPFLGPVILNWSLKVAARMLVDEEEKHWIARKLFVLGEQIAMARLDTKLTQKSKEKSP